MQHLQQDSAHPAAFRWLDAPGTADVDGQSGPDRQSAAARQAQTARRLAWLQERWNDDAYFETIMQSGRYLKLCNLLAWAETNDEEARERVALTRVSAGSAPTLARAV